MKEGSTLTFIELVNRVDAIQVPIIQRDYAQGRNEAVEVRRQFLSSIQRTLLEGYSDQPLDLDFIYGSFEDTGPSCFSVLDGQQRLTTLFLLHWYLAVKEGRLSNFQESFLSGSRSKFTYKVRVSASEFFDALAAADDISIKNVQGKISELIVDKRWFFLSWKSDPTVLACLTMLDAMHHLFYDSVDGLYTRLTDTENPRIVFQYLNLESFGLSDELYIKMNARGKPLSYFENFKAWLCSKLDKLDNGKQLELKLDQQWTDVFWKISQEANVEFDRLFLRFFNLMAFFRACEMVEGGYESLDQSWRVWLQRLRTSYSHIPTVEFERFSSFDEACLCRIELVLDYFYNNLSRDVVLKVLKDAVTSNDYISQAKFYSLVRFVNSSGSSGKWVSENEDSAFRWRRVTTNLINNHRIDELASFIPTIRSLADLSSHCLSIYEFLAEPGEKPGFTREQWEEESRKAVLILDDPTWESLIIRYEKHPYLKGKVGFLLDMATDPEEEFADKGEFKKAADKVVLLLSDEILRSDEFLLERALLSLGDYLVLDRSHRYSFCTPNRSTYRERSENWFRVVKKKVFERLVRRVGKDVEKSLRKIIGDANCGGWRQLVVDYPDVIRYCRHRLIHNDGSLIYLLSKSTFRGYHSELRTFVLNLVLQELEDDGQLPDEVSSFGYSEVYGDRLPHVWIEWNDKIMYVYYDGDGFSLWDDEEEPSQFEISGFLEDVIGAIFPEESLAC